MLSQALHAHFADASELRVSDRKLLSLGAHAAMPSGAGGIQIHNLSRTGMLVQTTADVPVGTAIEVEMPGGTRHHAEIVWRDTDLIGCRFAKPLSQATLSAALLRAAPTGHPGDAAPMIIDSDAIARLREHWAFEDDVAPTTETILPLRTRLWSIIGLGVACWAVPTAVVGWLLA